MPRNRSESFCLDSPEALFVFGGQDFEPISPQPGLTEFERWRFCWLYDRRSAAVERLGITEELRSLGHIARLDRIDAIAKQITSNIVGCEEIEKGRQTVATHYNARWHVDQQR